MCGLYRINARRRTNHGTVPYQPSEVDFLIDHVIPEDAWFILPIALIQHRTSVLFPPAATLNVAPSSPPTAKRGTYCASSNRASFKTVILSDAEGFRISESGSHRREKVGSNE